MKSVGPREAGTEDIAGWTGLTLYSDGQRLKGIFNVSC